VRGKHALTESDPKQLPWQNRSKEAPDDAEALARVQATVESQWYLQADEDVDFLHHDATRGNRLHVDYLKAELGLREHGIAHSVVVFGSTRIPDPAAALQALEKAREELKRNPQDPALLRRAKTQERIVEKSRYYTVAQEFSGGFGDQSSRRENDRIAIVTGGGPGVMEAANRGAYLAKGKSVGLNITLPKEQRPNPYLTPGLCFRFHYFALRKLHFMHRARALVAFPGGFGTFDELFEALTLVQTGKIKPLPIILVGKSYWTQAVNFDFLVDEGVITLEDVDLFTYAETAKDIREHIAQWYLRKGEPFI